jgi:putative transposase
MRLRIAVWGSPEGRRWRPDWSVLVMNPPAGGSRPLYPERKLLPHAVPNWVNSGATYFITVCCTPRGRNQLCLCPVASAIFESVDFRHSNHEWHAHLVLLMPDHVHALIAFAPDRSMVSSVRAWKGFLARRHGIGWQRNFFDHRIRDDRSFEEKAAYIRQNPIRAGLVAEAAEWTYVWEPNGRGEIEGRDRRPAGPCS